MSIRLRWHLTTLVVVMVVAAGLVGLNVYPKTIREWRVPVHGDVPSFVQIAPARVSRMSFGVPLPFIEWNESEKAEGFFANKQWNVLNLAADIFINIVVIILVGLLLELYIVSHSDPKFSASSAVPATSDSSEHGESDRKKDQAPNPDPSQQ